VLLKCHDSSTSKNNNSVLAVNDALVQKMNAPSIWTDTDWFPYATAIVMPFSPNSKVYS